MMNTSVRRPWSMPIALFSTVGTRLLPERLHILAEPSGVTRCHTTYNCTVACPREIQITVAIGELKMAMVTGKLE